jgi:hypothetical protein
MRFETAGMRDGLIIMLGTLLAGLLSVVWFAGEFL